MSGRSVKHTFSSKSAPILRVGLMSGFGLILLTGFLFLASWIALRNDWSTAILPAAAYICCGLSAFLCSFVCAKSISARKALFGILCTLPILILLLILCLTLYGKIGTGFAIAALVVLASAALGSIVAVRRKTKKTYKKIGAVR